MFRVSIDPSRNLLTIELKGFWTATIMAEYMLALRQQSSTLRAVGGCKPILVDMSSYPIQSFTIAEGHAAALRFAKETVGARAAIVMTSALSKLQASRVANSSGNEFFDNQNAALAWLMDDAD